MVGRSVAFSGLLARLEHAAKLGRPVLLLGERGTGKELCARWLHQATRPGKPFVALNCGTLTRELHLDQLFGHRRGAFSGALRDALGAFGEAEGGTLFLDEIGDLPPEAQVALLRPLQEGRMTRVGEAVEERFNVGIVAATNKDMAAELEQGRFRHDLYDRLAARTIRVPPLRERKGDVPLLAAHFLATSPALRVYGLRTLSADGITLLDAQRWPGNARELENVLGEAIRPDCPVIEPDHLRPFLPPPPPRPPRSPLPNDVRVLREITARRGVTRAELCEALSLPDTSAKRALDQLIEARQIERMGESRATWYRLYGDTQARPPLDPTARAAADLAQAEGRVTRGVLVERSGVHPRTVSRAFQRACASGALVGDGRAGSAAGYVVPGAGRTAARAAVVVASAPASAPRAAEPMALSTEEQDRRVLDALRAEDLSCEQLAAHLGQSARTASRVLKRLEHAGEVCAVRVGKSVVYRRVTT